MGFDDGKLRWQIRSAAVYVLMIVSKPNFNRKPKSNFKMNDYVDWKLFDHIINTYL
ncbi:hypothetical protein BH11BAC5_BH11BAC5_34640 [soil metagenome]|jgi:hypothetical protein